MPERLPLSVAVITKDEERNIAACLESVAFAGQVVVVDSGSTDATVAVARSLGAEVHEEAWRGGFGAQKQLAVDLCRRDWILVLDADERVPPETAAAIAAALGKADGEVAGFSFPRKNYFQGRWIRHAGWWPDRLTRLFRRGRGRMSTAAVHEGVEVDGLVLPLAAPILHYTEGDLGKILAKIDRYSTLAAETAFAEGRRATVYEAFWRAFFTFIQDYFLRLGALDGGAGLTLAVTDSVNKFFKYAKLARLSAAGTGEGGLP